MRDREISTTLNLCLCGCGSLVRKRFKKSHYFKGEKHPNYKTGKTKKRGYIYLWKNGKSIAEHRDVWERENNACLLSWADVDHINQIKDDNRPENLRAMMRGNHHRIHKTGNQYRRGKYKSNKNIR